MKVFDEKMIDELDDAKPSKNQVSEPEDEDLEDGLDDSLDDLEEEKPVSIQEKEKTLDSSTKSKKESSQRRTYKISITYDFYYNTPRLWIQGTDADNKPLTEAEIYEDIMSDYKGKTVTMEKHPNIGKYKVV